MAFYCWKKQVVLLKCISCTFISSGKFLGATVTNATGLGSEQMNQPMEII